MYCLLTELILLNSWVSVVLQGLMASQSLMISAFPFVSVEKVGGCTVYSPFSGPVTLTAPYRDPGIAWRVVRVPK